MSAAANFKYNIEVVSIKGENLRNAEFMSKNEPYLIFKVGQEKVHTTPIAKDPAKPSWEEKFSFGVGADQSFTIIAMDQDSKTESKKDDIVGQEEFLVKQLKEGSNVKSITLQHKDKAAGQISITLNCKINQDYEKKEGIIGRLIFRNTTAEITRDIQTFGNMDPQIIYSLGPVVKRSAVAIDQDKKPSWSEKFIFPIKAGSPTLITVKMINQDSKETEIGSGSIDVKDVIKKNGIFQKEPIQLSFSGKDAGIIYPDIEYDPMDKGSDPELFELQRHPGSVKISNIKATLTRDTESIGKMDPFATFKLNQVFFKTAVQDGVGKNPVWTETFTFELFSYMKNLLVDTTVLDKDSDSDDIVGKGQLDLNQFIGKWAEHQNQSVKLDSNSKPAGEIFFTVTAIENPEIKKHIEKKEKERKLAEEEKRKKDEEEKKRLEEERKKKELEDKMKKDEEDAKRQQQNQEGDQKNADALQKQREEQERREREAAERKHKFDEEEKLRLEQEALNDSQKGSKSHSKSRKFIDYNFASKNLKNGFGMSEFQSSHTLQNSVLSASFPKGERFNNSQYVRSSSPYTVLPSIFDSSLAAKKGTGFGYGNRGLLVPAQNPGPGAYDIADKLVKKYGVSFGESREACKNAVNILKMDVSRSTVDHSNRKPNSIRLPAINSNKTSGSQQDARLNVYPQYQASQNYHFARQSQQS